MQGTEANNDAFIRAYDEYADAIFRYCFLRLHDREKAKDVMQETFMRTWDYMRKEEVQNLRALLYRIAHNLCVNESVRHHALSLDEMHDATGFEPVDEHTRSPALSAETSILLERMRELRPPDRELLTLRYLNEMSVSEIAQMHGETPNTISVRIRRALDALRDKMEPR